MSSPCDHEEPLVVVERVLPWTYQRMADGSSRVITPTKTYTYPYVPLKDKDKQARRYHGDQMEQKERDQ